MQPTVSQMLSTMRLSLEQTVMPALPPDPFVQEQVGLMMATLDWLADAHESEYGFELADNRDHRAFLEGQGESVDPEPAPGDFAALRRQTRALKARAAAVVAEGKGAAELLAVAERQGRREQAWFRMTGFTVDVPGSPAEALEDVR